MQRISNVLIGLSPSALALCAGLGVLGVLITPTLSAESGASSLIEEVIVTATRREESIQDIPIAVSAFAGEDLEARGVQDLYGLQEVSPSISVYSSNSTSNGGTVRIRGVGTTGNNPGLEAAVGTFIDGVYRSRAGQAFSDFVDIDRIEVLRGPQGTLFGKNTSAGALQIITKQPEFERSSMVALSAGDFSSAKVQASTTGPLNDEVAYRVSFNWHQRDGYYENSVNDEAYDSRDRYTLKGQLLWQGDNFDNRVIVDYTDKDEDCCPANFHFSNTEDQGPSATSRGVLNSGVAPGAIIRDLLAETSKPAEPGGDTYDVGVNFTPFEVVEDKGIQNQFNWTINDNLSLSSITSYREFDVDRGQDIDFTGADLLQPQYTSESFENFSQELQLQFNTDRASYLVGAYLYTEDIVTDEAIRLAKDGPRYLSRYIVGLAPWDGGVGAGLSSLTNAPFGTTTGAGLGTYNPATGMYEGDDTTRRPNFQEHDGYAADFGQETEGWSIFTHNTFDLTETLTLTVGARYSNETKDAVTRINGVDPLQGSERDLLAAMLRDEFNEAHCTGLIFIGSLCNNVSWQDDETEQEWTGTVSLSYAFSDDINIYGSVSRGYKAGGFNLDQQAIEMDIFATFIATGGDPRFLTESGLAADVPQSLKDATGNDRGANGLTQFECGRGEGANNPNITHLDCAFFDDDHRFEPEFVNSYELGLKGQFLDGRLTTNIALFYSDFEDFQLNTFTGTGFLISNTKEMISRGMEIESGLFLTDNVYWSFGLTYADARYGDDLNDSRTETELYLAQEFALLEDWNSLENIEGRRITHAPAWQGSTSLFTEQAVFDNMMAYSNLNVGYRGPHNTGSDLRQEKEVNGEFLVNLQLGLRATDDRWDVQFWARNLLDNHIRTLVFNSVLQGGSYSAFRAPPRMMGATLRMNFR